MPYVEFLFNTSNTQGRENLLEFVSWEALGEINESLYVRLLGGRSASGRLLAGRLWLAGRPLCVSSASRVRRHIVGDDGAYGGVDSDARSPRGPALLVGQRWSADCSSAL